MTSDFIRNFNYNAEYNESLYSFEEGVDIIPEMIVFKQLGMGERECDKLHLLYRIEMLKNFMRENEAEDAEKVFMKESINALIRQYNEL